jgi:hypothetical protein
LIPLLLPQYLKTAFIPPLILSYKDTTQGVWIDQEINFIVIDQGYPEHEQNALLIERLNQPMVHPAVWTDYSCCLLWDFYNYSVFNGVSQ